MSALRHHRVNSYRRCGELIEYRHQAAGRNVGADFP